jgi:hypothetical protein
MRPGGSDGVVRRLQVAIGVDLWTIQSGRQLFEVSGGLDPVYQVDGLPVTFDGRVRRGTASLLDDAGVIELVTISVR